MRIFISVDIEGVAGVVASEHGRRGNADYELARRLMTHEANAAIAGAAEAGATEIAVADSHGPMTNLIAAEIDPRARLVSGKPRPLSMIQGVRPDDHGVILIGYHAAAGRRGVLAHTINSRAFSRIDVNGVQASEATLFAGHAAEIGVPLLAASGDDCLAEDLADQFPEARSIVVKQALGAAAADSLAPQASCDLIRREVAAAVSAPRPAARMVTPPPLRVAVRFVTQIQADVAALLPFCTREDSTTVSFKVASYAEAIGVLANFSFAAMAVS